MAIRSAVILCGGASRRMGRDKATLGVGGQTLIEHVVAQLRPLVDRLIVAAAVDQPLPELGPDVRVVRDAPGEPGGPLRGLAAAWDDAADGERSLVWACDCPLVVPALVERLFQRAQGRQAAVPRILGHLQPLTAVYDPAAARSVLRALQAEGRGAAFELAERLDTAWLDEAEWQEVDPLRTLLTNVNTPAEFARFTARDDAQALSLPRQLLDLHERERRLTAYDIHDGLVQDVTGALLRVDALRGQPLDAAMARKLGEIADLLRKAIDEGRRLIAGLRPPILDEAGLLGAIRYLIEGEFRAAGLEVALACDDDLPRASDLLETSVFRMVHEALTNVARHSGVSAATVELRREDGQLTVVIRDGGRGFDPARVDQLRFGLRGVRDRAQILGGGAEVSSRPGQGASIRVWLPLAGG